MGSTPTMTRGAAEIYFCIFFTSDSSLSGFGQRTTFDIHYRVVYARLGTTFDIPRYSSQFILHPLSKVR